MYVCANIPTCVQYRYVHVNTPTCVQYRYVHVNTPTCVQYRYVHVNTPPCVQYKYVRTCEHPNMCTVRNVRTAVTSLSSLTIVIDNLFTHDRKTQNKRPFVITMGTTESHHSGDSSLDNVRQENIRWFLAYHTCMQARKTYIGTYVHILFASSDWHNAHYYMKKNLVSSYSSLHYSRRQPS